MGRIPQELREIIAANIRACRIGKYPGRGGGKKCAEAFGVSPQQWSPWERGRRVPDEVRLEALAKFFEVTVEYLRRDNSSKPEEASAAPSTLKSSSDAPCQPPTPPAASTAHIGCPFYNPPPSGQPFTGEVRSMCWLAERFFGDLATHGLPIRLSANDLAILKAMLQS